MRSDILLEPVVTEKSNQQREAHKYTFKVDARANKHQILTAVRDLFGGNPAQVQHHQRGAQAQAGAPSPGAPRELEEGDRDPVTGRHDPDIRGSLGRCH